MKRYWPIFAAWLLIHTGYQGRRQVVAEFESNLRCEIIHHAMLNYEVRLMAESCQGDGFFDCIWPDKYECREGDRVAQEGDELSKIQR